MHTILQDRLQWRSHLPKPIIGGGVLHPNSALLLSKLTRHQAEGKHVTYPFQHAPTINLHIIKVQCGLWIGREVKLKISSIAIQDDLLLNGRRPAIIMILAFADRNMGSHMVIVYPSIIIHRITQVSAIHASLDKQRLVFRQIREYEWNRKRSII